MNRNDGTMVQLSCQEMDILIDALRMRLDPAGPPLELWPEARRLLALLEAASVGVRPRRLPAAPVRRSSELVSAAAEEMLSALRLYDNKGLAGREDVYRDTFVEAFNLAISAAVVELVGVSR